MNPNPPEFDYPKTASDVFLHETRQQLSGECFDGVDECLVRPQDHDAGRWFRREAQNIAKVEIERDEAPLFPSADVINRLIGCAVKFLIVNRRNIMTGLAQNPGNGKPEILVELELHADFSIGSGTYRSRDISAP